MGTHKSNMGFRAAGLRIENLLFTRLWQSGPLFGREGPKLDVYRVLVHLGASAGLERAWRSKMGFRTTGLRLENLSTSASGPNRVAWQAILLPGPLSISGLAPGRLMWLLVQQLHPLGFEMLDGKGRCGRSCTHVAWQAILSGPLFEFRTCPRPFGLVGCL